MLALHILPIDPLNLSHLVNILTVSTLLVTCDSGTDRQTDRQRHEVKYHCDRLSGGIAHDLIRRQCDTDWDSGTLTVMSNGRVQHGQTEGQWDTYRDVIKGQQDGPADGRFRQRDSVGQCGTVGHSP